MKRSIAGLLIVLLLTGLLPFGTLAEDTPWWEQDIWDRETLTELGAVAPAYNAEEQRYEISLPEQLLFLSGLWKPEDADLDGAPDAPCNGTYVLTADLDMAPLMESIGKVLTEKRGEETAGYMPPIAALADEKEEEGVHCAFFGMFNGQGHAIRNLRVVRMGAKYCGLFGNIGHDFGQGFVRDLAVLDAEIVGLATCGILAGTLQGDAENVVCTGTIDCAEKNAGGLAGKIKRNENGYYAIARNCFVYADILVRGRGVENGAVGGVSASNSKGGQIVNCFIGGSIRVLGEDADSVAGVVGNLKGGIAIDNNVMLLTAIDGGDDSQNVGLLCGNYSGESGSHLHNNYVWEGTRLLGGAATDHPVDAAYAEATAAQIRSKEFYSETLGWDFETAWAWVGEETEGNPIPAPFAELIDFSARIAEDLTVSKPVLHMAEPTAASAYQGDGVLFSARVLLPEGKTVSDAALHFGNKKARGSCTGTLPMAVSDERLSVEYSADTIGSVYYYLTATVDGETVAFPTEGTARLSVVSAETKYLPEQITVSPGASADTVGINWITESDELTGSVLLREAGTSEWSRTVPVTEKERVNVRGDHGSFTSFSVDLDGLKPQTAYEYIAVTNDGKADYHSPVYTFTTLPSDGAFSFVVISDLQATNEEGYYPYLYTYNGFIRDTLQPDFLVNLGDFTEDDTMAEWRYFFDVLGELQAGTLTSYTPGNHEAKGDVVYSHFKGRTNLPQGIDDEMLAETTGAFVVGNVCFVTLNTEPYTGIDGADASKDKMMYYEKQKAWAKEVFETSGCEWRVIFAHAGLVQKDPDATAFLEQMCEELQVDLFFNGHIHDYFRATVNGAGEHAAVGDATTFLTVSTMGPKFDDYGGEIDDILDFQTGGADDTRHYLAQVQVDAQGITVTVYRRVSAAEVTKKNCSEYEVIDSVRLESDLKPEEQPTAAPTEAPQNEPPAEKPKKVENMWIWIGVGAAAVLGVVLISILYRRRSRS